jgi:hypothetical protein
MPVPFYFLTLVGPEKQIKTTYWSRKYLHLNLLCFWRARRNTYITLLFIFAFLSPSKGGLASSLDHCLFICSSSLGKNVLHTRVII